MMKPFKFFGRVSNMKDDLLQFLGETGNKNDVTVSILREDK
jgi:hypothetical protein